ncbi:MAG TPA: TylF/MycF/NovP-related O-methyltransferase [Blastocatellia bacterium]|nr:TylF/MycF/NovP-related O-methyltransferase [Blastocatellia bacterium]
MKAVLKKQINTVLKDTLGLKIVRAEAPRPLAAPRYQKNLLYEADTFFNQLYDEALAWTETPDVGEKRRERRYNHIQFFQATLPLDGWIAECGCWKGLSSFMMCRYAVSRDPRYDGEGFHIFDSFEGLSTPKEEDVITDQGVDRWERGVNHPAGTYAAPLDHVRRVLSEFPGIQYHKGWLPESLKDAPEGRFKFVHIDVDLFEPTKGALEYFYPRLVPGGMLMCDDYGSLYWPGARKAVDDYSIEHNIPVISVSTGQAVLWKR